MTEPLRIFIAGSCVSRDTFEYLVPESFTLLEYVARQSLASAFGPTADPPLDLSLLTSPFQRRMLDWDAASRLPDLVRESAGDVDVLLWDIVDERLGLVQPPEGGVLTSSVELRDAESRGLTPSPLDGPAFGTPRHRTLFARALERWRRLLDDLDLRERTVLLAPRWAEVSTAGEPVPTSFGLAASYANELTDEYVGLIRDIVGVRTAGRDVLPVADADHRWGPAAFHYDPATYRALALDIVTSLDAMELLDDGSTDLRALVRDPQPGSHRERAGVAPRPVRVSLTRSADDELLVEIFGSERQPCSFGLFRGPDRVAATPYIRATAHRFPVPGPGTYRARVFVRSADGRRVPVSSRGLTVA